MKILTTSKMRGPSNVLAPVVRELQSRGHQTTIYATGNETEAAGFSGLDYQQISPQEGDYKNLVEGHDVVIVGMSGYNSPDGDFVRASNSLGIPVIAVQDQNSNYQERLGNCSKDFPTLLTLMDENCFNTIKEEYSSELAEELIEKGRVIGWAGFDHYAQLKEEFTDKQKAELLNSISLNPDDKAYLHFTQNLHPDCDYMARVPRSREEKKDGFDYEMKVTQAVFEAASDLGIKLAVKPHPGEKFETNYTKDLAEKHGFTFVPANACNTQQIMLAAHSVTAGRSTCLTEACLLDKNTGGIIPDLGEEWVNPFPPMNLGAIPYTQDWEGINEVVNLVASSDKKVNKTLADYRKSFSVDGKASKRLADLVESLG